VPTLDTARYTFLLDTLLRNDKPVLFVGPTGTGKTVYVQKLLLHLPAKEWNSIFINYSAQTSANQSQDIIDGKLDKRRKGVFGPPMGKRCVIFVDDLNMPALETYGAQPPIELLRQFMDHEGWYDRKENSFRKLVDLSFICAMGPPGGGRNPITPRYMRHFNIIAFTPFDDPSMQRIFQTIFDWWLQREGFDMGYLKLSQPIISATMDIYKASMASLLPTPSKSYAAAHRAPDRRSLCSLLLPCWHMFDMRVERSVSRCAGTIRSTCATLRASCRACCYRAPTTLSAPPTCSCSGRTRSSASSTTGSPTRTTAYGSSKR
jgi:dynein heavy chain